MSAVNKISGKGVYVAGNDIDTDRIIPARYLKCVTFDELGPSLFYDERFDADGRSKDHVLDAAAHQGAKVLVTDDNFGCGSSREHAPQAIQKFGLEVVISGSFAEIFHGNCTTLGIPCVVMSQENRTKLAGDIALDPEAELIVDLESMHVLCANSVYPVTMKESAREAFLSATYDPLDNLMAASDDVRRIADKLGYS